MPQNFKSIFIFVLLLLALLLRRLMINLVSLSESFQDSPSSLRWWNFAVWTLVWVFVLFGLSIFICWVLYSLFNVKIYVYQLNLGNFSCVISLIIFFLLFSLLSLSGTPIIKVLDFLSHSFISFFLIFSVLFFFFLFLFYFLGDIINFIFQSFYYF